MSSRYFVGILLFIILFCCQEDKELARPYPVVNTLPITEISKDGAVFNAEIISENLSDIIEHGFVWAADKNAVFNVDNSLLIKLGLPSTTNVSFVVNSTLESNKEYKVRSYLKTKNKIIYGKVVTFFSLGSFGPLLLNANPGEGALGDTIKLIGKNFSFKAEKNIVKFGDIQASVVQSSDTEMKVVIPEDVNSLTPLVSISIDENISKLSKTFTIKGPQIFSVTPENPSLCDTIFIRGSYFVSNPIKNQILFDNKVARIAKASITEIQVLALATEGPIKSLKVKSGGLETISSINLTQKLPEVTEDLALSDTLVIHGKNLPICYNDLVVNVVCTVGNCGYYYQKVLSKTENEIKLLITNPSCLSQTLKLDFLSGNDLIYQIKNIKTSKPKIISISPTTGEYTDVIVIKLENVSTLDLSAMTVDIGGPARILTKTKNEIRCKLYENVVAPNGYLDVILSACQSTAIIKEGFYLKPPKILDFIPKEIKSPTDQLIISGENFSPTNNIVKLGANAINEATNITFSNNQITVANSNQLIKDIYMSTHETYPISIISGGQSATSLTNLIVNYDGMWTKLKDFVPTPRTHAASFSVNGKGYFVSGSSASEYLNDVWEYNPINDSWSRMSDFPGGGRINSTIMVLSNKAYFGLGYNDGGDLNDWWEFDIDMNKWTRKADYPGTIISGSFAIGNYGFVIGNTDYSIQLTDLWQYDQAQNQWKQKEKLLGIPYRLTFAFNGLGHAFTFANEHVVYNPAADHWEVFDNKIPEFANVSGSNLALINDKILHIGIGYQGLTLHDYNPLQGTWKKLPYRGPIRSSPIFFSVNNLLFLGSGHYSEPVNAIYYANDFWQIDPDKIDP